MCYHFCGVRGSTPAPGASSSATAGTPRASRWPTTPTRRRRSCSTPARGCARVTALLGGGPFAGTILLTHLHWDHTHGLPFFAAGDRDDARVTLLLPDQEEGTARRRCWPGMSPPHFPIRPGQLRGDWTFGTISPGQFKAEGSRWRRGRSRTRAAGRSGTGSATGARVVAYVPDHCPTVLGPGPDGLGRIPPGRRRTGRRRRPAGARRPAAGRGTGGRGGVRPCRGRVRGRPAARAGARRWCCSTTSPDRTDDRT